MADRKDHLGKLRSGIPDRINESAGSGLPGSRQPVIHIREACMAAKIIPVLLATMDGCDYSHNVYDTNFGVKVRSGMLGFVIQDADRLIVFDTGPDMEEWADTGVTGDPVSAFDDALEKLGKYRSDVDTVILSHLHSDHVGNIREFPSADIVIGRKEMAYAAAPINPIYYNAQEIADILMLQDRLHFAEDGEEISPSVRLMQLGGHTPGSMGALVETRRGMVALAGDFLCVYENLETRSVTITNVDEWILSLRKLRAAADIILPGHEIRVMDDYPEIG